MENAQNPVSTTVFEIVDSRFVFRSWFVTGNHLCYEDTPQRISFGKTGISLELRDGEPVLVLPAACHAELRRSDHAFKGCERVEGNFVEVAIW